MFAVFHVGIEKIKQNSQNARERESEREREKEREKEIFRLK